jgi:putative transcriptional regulator
MAVTKDAYHSLLMDYASGALDEPHALLVAAHLSLSPNARKLLQQYESVGGSLLQECCAPVGMKTGALQAVLNKLDCLTEECREAKREAKCREMQAMPKCLQKYMEVDHETLPWKDAPDGMRTITVKTSCCKSKAELVKYAQGRNSPVHTQQRRNITLVLKGIFRDGQGVYSKGDLIITETDGPHELTAEDGNDILYLAVTPVQPRFRGWIIKFFR